MTLRYLLPLLLFAVPARAELKTDIVFATAGGVPLTLDAFVPEGDGPFPTCILVHGGGFTKGDKTSYIKPLFEPLSKAGFTWFTINYRLAPQHRFPACVEDVETAIRWVKTHAAEYKADPQRIALIGESAGGHLVSLAGVRAEENTRVAAVVPFYAPHDLELRVKQSPSIPVWVEALFGMTQLDDAAWKVLRDASPISHIHHGLPPYLLIHGTKDDQVPFEQSLEFQEKMKAASNACELIGIEGGAHGMGGWERIDPRYKEKLVAWLRRTLAAESAGDVDVYQPPEIEPQKILPGTTKQFTFTQSEIFPGTVRDVTVFIPAQYDATTPACVYVKTDGFNPREQTLLETMIATREMPVTIGVFVRPGDLPPPMRGTLGRRNRCFEYDGVNDNNVRFLTDELLPFVAKECDLNLSTDGNDRCISGGSSGGIAAFTAAWNRPEAFSRVYAASGSWVAFRGGHEFPTMVRKFEAKPIRAFLTTATHDMENAAGDWFLLDQEMDKALKFSGYDYQFRIIEGRHVQGYIENWQEGMAYLWRDWPERVQAGPSAPRAQEILIPGENWQLVADVFQSTRGPACNASGEVFFADTSNNKIHRIDLQGKVSEFVGDADQANCVTVGADGKVYTLSEKSGRLMSYDSEGTGTLVLDGICGHSLLASPGGGFYVTSNGDTPDEPGKVWFIKDGQKTLVDSGLKFATGLAYRPDRWLLSVADGHSKWVYSYQMNADGSLTNKERFFHLYVADWDDEAGVESICYSLEGRQFIATRSGVQISADDGPTQVILPVPDRSRAIGVCLGGKEMDTLFAFCGTKVWKRRVQHHAMGAFTPWTKVSGTKL